MQHAADAELQELQAEVTLADLKEEFEENRRKRVEDARRRFRETKARIEKARAERQPLRGKVALEEIADRQREEILEARELLVAEKDIGRAAEGTIQSRFDERQRIRQEVVLGKEMLEERLDRFYQKQVAEGKVQQIRKGRRAGYTYRRNGPVHEGLISSRTRGKVIDSELIESVAAESSRIAERLLPRIKDGKLYATFSFFDYGRNVPGSSFQVSEDEFGAFYQSFDSLRHRFKVESVSVAEFESEIRELLLERATAGGNVALLDAFEVKAFREKSKDETREWDRARRKSRLGKEGKK